MFTGALAAKTIKEVIVILWIFVFGSLWVFVFGSLWVFGFLVGFVCCVLVGLLVDFALECELCLVVLCFFFWRVGRLVVAG